MSNSRRRYRAILTKLVKLNSHPQGRALQRLQVLAAFISGIVGSQRIHGREVAKHSGIGGKVESRTKRFSRWYKNDNVSHELDYLPYIDEVLAALAGHACMVLMVSLLYNNRAIPLVWTVFQRPKGHASAQEHIDLLKLVHPLLPSESEVVFLGDGEFDSVELQTYIRDLPQWEYVCRTAKNTLVYCDGEWFSLDSIVIGPDTCLTLEQVLFTRQEYGFVQIVLWWASHYSEPIYLVTSLEIGQDACYWYRQRMKIETFFSDQKSRGFHLHKSHIDDPTRLICSFTTGVSSMA